MMNTIMKNKHSLFPKIKPHGFNVRFYLTKEKTVISSGHSYSNRIDIVLRMRIFVNPLKFLQTEVIMITEKLVDVRAYTRFRFEKTENVCKHTRRYPQ